MPSTLIPKTNRRYSGRMGSNTVDMEAKARPYQNPKPWTLAM
jgi:hypothetical protein